MDRFSRQLKQLKQEDFIWLIYFFIVIFALVANRFEENFLLTQNKTSQKYGQKITTTILIVAFFIYLYFTLISFDNLEYLKRNSNNKDIKVAFERLIANILFLVAGAIAIYADYDSNSPNIDIGII
ncbi:MAG: hypothetical protein E7161_05130 [Firmicutes bacterium]|nr:hypothetical protein [Bacillota bacterium]